MHVSIAPVPRPGLIPIKSPMTDFYQALSEPGPRRDPPSSRRYPRQLASNITRQGHRRPFRPFGHSRLQSRIHDPSEPGGVPRPGVFQTGEVGAANRRDENELPPVQYRAPQLHRNAPGAYGYHVDSMPTIPALRPPTGPGDDGGAHVRPGSGRDVPTREDGSFPCYAAQVRRFLFAGTGPETRLP